MKYLYDFMVYIINIISNFRNFYYFSRLLMKIMFFRVIVCLCNKIYVFLSKKLAVTKTTSEYIASLQDPFKDKYRASHIILDYLQSLTPKLTLKTRKTYHFPKENSYISLMLFFKMIHSNEIF